MSETNVFIISGAIVVIALMLSITHYNANYDPLSLRIWECRQMKSETLVSECLAKVTSE